MTLKEFIHANRAEIDTLIDRALNHVPATASCYCPQSGTAHTHTDGRKRSDSERRRWIINDEGLYAWARSSGVCI